MKTINALILAVLMSVSVGVTTVVDGSRESDVAYATVVFQETDQEPAASAITEDVVYRTDIPLSTQEQVALIDACREFDVPYELALAVIWQETDYQHNIGDSGNSMGYMQLQPRWVWPEMEELGVTDLMDPVDNFRVGCLLLGRYIAEHGIEGGLTRYNTGSPGWSRYAEEVMEKWEVLNNVEMQ